MFADFKVKDKQDLGVTKHSNNIEDDLISINASCTGISKQFKVYLDVSDFCQAGNPELQS